MFLDFGIEHLLIYLFLSAAVYHSDCQVCPQHSCNWETSEEFPFPLCYCDQICHIYGDCCQDAAYFNTDDGQNTSDAIILRFDDRYCLPRHTDDEIGFRVVNKCNEEFCFSDPLKIKSILPVTIATGKTFLNADCARCNGQSDFRFWDIVLIPNPQETDRFLQNENTTNEDLIAILLQGKYHLILNLDKIAPPRFCLRFLDVGNSCPNYLSPHMCGSLGLERNMQCSLESKRVCKLNCMDPLNPFLLRFGRTNPMSVLLRFHENDNLEGEEESIYHMEIRNPSVSIIVSYWEKSPLFDIKIKRFLGALYISMQHHSGYKFVSFISYTSFTIETRNCSSYTFCYKYSFYFNLKARIAEDRIFIQNFLKKEITLRYVDKDLAYEIPMATLTITSSVDTSRLRKFWFPIYSSLSGNFKNMSEMQNCKRVSISATFNDENQKADVDTRCTKSLKVTNGQTASQKMKWIHFVYPLIATFIRLTACETLISNTECPALDELVRVNTRNSIAIRKQMEELEKEQQRLLSEISIQGEWMTSILVQSNDLKGLLNNAGQFGREFILSFPVVLTSVRDIQVMMVSLADGSITLSSEISGVDRSVKISSKSGVSLSLPTNLLRGGSYVARNSVTIRSSTDIAVFVVILGSSGTGDGYMAIPATSLRKKYFFSMNQNALLSIVSFSDETDITIVRNAGAKINLRSSGLSSSNTTITLTRGQVLQIRHGYWVMGYVTGSKPFMFLHGSHGDSAYSRYRASFIDSVFYTDARLFIIPYLYNGTDTVTFCNRKRSLSFKSNLRLSTSTNYVCIRGQKKVSYIRADFQTSCHYIGHGFSVSVSPVTSYSTYCRFLTPYGSNFTHHAAVTVKTTVDDGIKLQSISNKNDITANHRETITVDGVSYSAIYYTVEAGQYEVYHTSSNVTFGVISYGFGNGTDTAYGFPVCFKKF